MLDTGIEASHGEKKNIAGHFCRASYTELKLFSNSYKIYHFLFKASSADYVMAFWLAHLASFHKAPTPLQKPPTWFS